MKRDIDPRELRTAGKRILLVDDDPITLKLVCAMLTQAGYEVTVSVDADSALRAANVGAIDVLVTDILMPGRSGVDLITTIRAARPDLPIIAISAGAGLLPAEFTLRSAALVGALQTLPKPIHRDALLQAVRGALTPT